MRALAWVAGVALVVTALAAAHDVRDTTVAAQPGTTWYLQSNLAGGWADGAELDGTDDVVDALADRIAALDLPPRAVFLNEACESHGAHLAARLGPAWRVHFVQAWPGRSDCFPAPGSAQGRYGNAVLVPDDTATPLVIPSCNDPGSAPDACLPNWAPPAEQRRGICARSDGELLCSVHLDPKRWEWHDEQLATLGRIAARLGLDHERIVVGGDLNAGREATRRAFAVDGAVRFVDLAGPRPLLTYPSDRPRREIDHLLVGSRTPVRPGGSRTVDLGRCEATYAVDHRCSDHLALLAGMVAG